MRLERKRLFLSPVCDTGCRGVRNKERGKTRWARAGREKVLPWLFGSFPLLDFLTAVAVRGGWRKESLGRATTIFAEKTDKRIGKTTCTARPNQAGKYQFLPRSSRFLCQAKKKYDQGEGRGTPSFPLFPFPPSGGKTEIGESLSHHFPFSSKKSSLSPSSVEVESATSQPTDPNKQVSAAASLPPSPLGAWLVGGWGGREVKVYPQFSPHPTTPPRHHHPPTILFLSHPKKFWRTHQPLPAYAVESEQGFPLPSPPSFFPVMANSLVG